ncbi:hypothetical protein PsorP6_001316 [Peronosclerospora sorghi]|uniref:Uncharacterized protein n=1 Tax=Peronosclerospora sorghi TaxID=230839 RepID=A0ACC0WXI2_9STRA|nr:hypothetical protein PsorP6_001316 [Peronosclerospora sorghi]
MKACNWSYRSKWDHCRTVLSATRWAFPTKSQIFLCLRSLSGPADARRRSIIMPRGFVASEEASHGDGSKCASKNDVHVSNGHRLFGRTGVVVVHMRRLEHPKRQLVVPICLGVFVHAMHGQKTRRLIDLPT